MVRGPWIALTPPTLEPMIESASLESAVTGCPSAIGNSVERRAYLSMPADAKLSEFPCEHRLGHSSEAVERCDAVMVDPFIGPDRDACGDASDGAGQRSDDDVVEHG